MAQVRVLVSDSIHEDGIRMMERAGLQVERDFEISPDQLRARIGEYQVLIVRSRTKVTAEVIKRASALKIIGRAGAGLDNVDLDAAIKQGIKVLNTPDAPANSVAELTIGLMISLARRIPLADRGMKEERWLKKELAGTELRGKTLGIIGLGNIGMSVGRVARAMGMSILNATPRPKPDLLRELDAKHLPLDDLLKQVDFLTLHVPLSQETKGMLGRGQLNLMKRSAYLINTSRGEIVDEKALLEVLREGRIAGAALDVYSVEPPTDYELMKLPNVVCTPHIGAQTEDAQVTASRLIAQKVIEAAKAL